MRRLLTLLTLLIAVAVAPSWTQAPSAAPITYQVSFPEPEHHWMQVEVTFTNLGTPPLDARMSRSSPGRYAVAEFAKKRRRTVGDTKPSDRPTKDCRCI